LRYCHSNTVAIYDVFDSEFELSGLHAGPGRCDIGLLLLRVKAGEHLIERDVIADIDHAFDDLPPTRNDRSVSTPALMVRVRVPAGANSERYAFCPHSKARPA
jgi:hypothetical protein